MVTETALPTDSARETTTVPTEPSLSIIAAKEAAASALVVATEIQQAVATYVISSQEQLDQATAEVNAIQKRWTEVEMLRKKLKAPILEAAANVDATFTEPLTRLQSAKAVLKGAIDAYLAEQRRIAQEAERAALAKAEAERKRLATQAERAEAKGDIAKADDLAYRAATVPAVTPQVEVPKVRGYASVETWSAEVTDIAALLKWIAEDPAKRHGYVTVNQSALNSVAKAMKTSMDIPGVRPVVETKGRPTGR